MKGDEVLGMVEGLPDMVPFPLRDEIGMGMTCYTFIMSMSKVKYTYHLQWYIMSKSPTV